MFKDGVVYSFILYKVGAHKAFTMFLSSTSHVKMGSTTYFIKNVRAHISLCTV